MNTWLAISRMGSGVMANFAQDIVEVRMRTKCWSRYIGGYANEPTAMPSAAQVVQPVAVPTG